MRNTIAEAVARLIRKPGVRDGVGHSVRPLTTAALAASCLLTVTALGYAGQASAKVSDPASDTASYTASDPKVRTYSIPSQPVSTALKAFAAQSDLQLIYTELDVADATTAGVKGDLAPGEALKKILQGSNLEYEITASNVVVIRKPSATKTTAGYSKSGNIHLAQATQTPESPNSSSEPSSDSSENKGQLEEVVVTAQKREERLQDVSISISVVSGRELDTNTGERMKDMLMRVPGVALTEAGFISRNSTIAVRGVTPIATLRNGSSTTAYYLDAAPFGFVRQAFAPEPDAYDMQRLEVLRGPQGTLYGASALNGVVRVLTKDANPDAFEFNKRTSASKTKDRGDNYRGDMAVNVPPIDNPDC